MSTRRLVFGCRAASLSILFVLAACSDDTPAATPVAATGDPVTAVPAGPIERLADVAAGVVHVVSDGSFVAPPASGAEGPAGTSSGFIVAPSGVAVTTSHAVTGGSAISVWRPGATAPLPAKLVGTSECADLAVIDIDGEGFPFLTWYAGEVAAGLEVHAAGVSPDTRAYALTSGSLVRTGVPGALPRASVPSVLQHDAAAEPAAAGGPLVTAAAQLVGVNYGPLPERTEWAASGREAVQPLIERLAAGERVGSIGVNGQAVADAGQRAGVWVWGIAPESPAQSVGLQPGDLIVDLQQTPVGRDGTVVDYCTILSGVEAGTPIDLEVARPASGETLEGQLHGAALTPSTPLVDPAVRPAAPGRSTPTSRSATTQGA